MPEQEELDDWPETYFDAGKRTHLESGQLTDWFVGYGKDRSCQFEGSWHAMVILAAQILSSENTKLAVENSDLPGELYRPELREIAVENEKYTGSAYDFKELDIHE